MLTKRIIAVILLRDGRAVKSRQFANYRDVGNPVSQARIYYANGIDELVILNTQSEKGIHPLREVLPEISKQCFIPVSAGGGIKTISDVEKLFLMGCEKVVVRTQTELIPEVADKFGRQAVIECRDDSKAGRWGSDESPEPWQRTEAGELLWQDRDKDGTMEGYGTYAIQSDVPLIRLGGCGSYQHMLDAFNAGADACAAGSLWAFTDSNPLRCKKWLRNHGVNVRAA